jgi:hypothetical protein
MEETPMRKSPSACAADPTERTVSGGALARQVARTPSAALRNAAMSSLRIPSIACIPHRGHSGSGSAKSDAGGDSPEARFLLVVEPAGFEGFVRELSEPAGERTLPPATVQPPSPEQMTATAAKYGLDILGPPGIPT